MKLKRVKIETYATDHRESFAGVKPKEKHKTGKEFTKKAEGVNNLVQNKTAKTRKKNHRLFQKAALSLVNDETGYHKTKLSLILLLKTQPFFTSQIK